MRFAVPATILFATCSVYGRMAAQNEIIAVKAQGISPVKVIWPAWIVAFMLSLGSVWLNDIAVSWGKDGVKKVIIESVEDIVYGLLQKQGSYSNKQISITVKRVEGRRLIFPTITMAGGGDKPPMTINCQYAEMRSDTEQNYLTITCHAGTLEVGGGRMNFPDDWETVVPLAEVSKKSPGAGSPSERPMWAIPHDCELQRAAIARLEQDFALRAGYEMMTGDFDALVSPQWVADQQRLSSDRSLLNRLLVEPHRRWANGFSCLCFVMVGAPLAIRFRNSDFLTSFFATFLPILLVYYPFLMYGVDRAKSGAFPPFAVWGGNVVLAGAGLWLMRKVIRY